MGFSPQRPAIFQHLNFKKCSVTVSFLRFWLQNVLLATAACNFCRSQLQKVVRTCSVSSEQDTDTWQSGTCGSLSRFIVPLLYKQVTPTKRELLLWENVPQAICSVIFLLAEGGSLFVMVINLLIPICQVVATFALFRPLRQAMGPNLGILWRAGRPKLVSYELIG